MRTAPQQPTPDDAPVLLFDGACNLCNSSVIFFLTHEREPRARFASLQSGAAARLLEATAIDPSELDSVVLLMDGRAWTRSSAVLRASAMLRAPWSWLRLLLIVPAPIRDAGYRLIARSRYRVFGRRDSCMIPTPGVRARFLDAPTTEPSSDTDPASPAG